MWRDIKGYEGLYKVNQEGQILSVKRNRIKSIRKGMNGYRRIDLWKNGVRKTKYIHRIVALTFLEQPSGMKEVNHKDKNVENNRLENLEWIEKSDNLNNREWGG